MIVRKALMLSALAMTLGLSGCISLFPKAKPVQLYRFDGPAAGSVVQPEVSVLRGPTAFTRAAATDRILTTMGPESAYIKDARWAAPASVMFDEALAAAFDGSRVRLATRGEIIATDGVLRVEVRTFEARYVGGKDTAPVAVVEARATISSARDRDAIATRMFRAEKPAADNRVGPIVEAFDGAAEQVLREIVSWTGETVRR